MVYYGISVRENVQIETYRGSDPYHITYPEIPLYLCVRAAFSVVRAVPIVEYNKVRRIVAIS